MICAMSSVPKPFRTERMLKNIKSEIAVTISGFITGRSFTRSTIVCKTFLHLERPMAVTVPTTVDTTVASTAITTV